MDGSVIETVARLARRKAEYVAVRVGPGAYVLGCDSLLEVDGVARGKPASIDQARAWWRSMRGRAGELRTGHCVLDTTRGVCAEEVVTTTVRFGNPSDAELEAYLASGEALAVAGAFTLAGRSAAFIDGVDGDANNVEGLSLAALRRLLGRLGVELVELWA